jgi:hypothetical protein
VRRSTWRGETAREANGLKKFLGEIEMARFIGTLVILAAIVAGVGYYLNWFSFSASDDKKTDGTEINIHIDKAKIKADTEKAKEKAQDLEHKVEQEIKDHDAKK